MTAMQLLEALRLPAETEKVLRAMPLPEEFEALRQAFWNREELFQTYAAQSKDGLAVLRLYLEFALETQANYARVGIPESYFWDSIRDITIWCWDYWDKFHTPGFIEWEWLAKTLRMGVIRIGRLQFEPITLKQDVSLFGQSFAEGIAILDVHIPAGEPLDPAAAMDSIGRAPDFYKTYFDREFPLFHCHSWLLSPSLPLLLPEGSRILRFKNLFTVYATDDERQAEERVFGYLAENPKEYPENTSLQRAVKQHLLAGKTVEMAAGLRLL